MSEVLHEGEYLMRRAGFRVRPGWAAALVCAVSLSGCKKQEPAPAEPAAATPKAPVQVTAAAAADAGTKAADAGTATAEADEPKPFHFKDVEISHYGRNLNIKYTLENRGRKRARGTTCLWLHDKDGAYIEKVSLGPISLRGGESDRFEDTTPVDERWWKQTSTVQLYAGNGCYGDPEGGLSPARRLDVNGRPPLEEVPPVFKAATPEAGTPVFVVKDLQLRQAEPSSPVSVTFTVTNKGTVRARAELCLRLYEDARTTCHLDEADAEVFNLAPGASETLTAELSLSDDKHWDSAALVKAFASAYGCVDKEKEALSNVMAFPTPDGIHGPREGGEEPEHVDEPSEEDAEDGETAEPVAEPLPEDTAESE